MRLYNRHQLFVTKTEGEKRIKIVKRMILVYIENVTLFICHIWEQLMIFFILFFRWFPWRIKAVSLFESRWKDVI